MRRSVNLLEGPILPSLSKLALPIMATSFIQMAYNLTDMFWIGRLGSGAVAAVGSAGMYPWFANGFSAIARMGGQVRAGYALGAKNEDEAVRSIESSLQLGILMGITYGAIAIIFASPLIGFFQLNDAQVVADAEAYMRFTSGGIIFSFLNTILSGLVTAMGNSRISFLATATGLVANMILDPVLIFGIGPFPKMRVMGAAIATVFAQSLVTMIFVLCIYKEEKLFRKARLFKTFDKEDMASIIRIGVPTGVQTMVAAGISMIIARMIAGFGDGAVAVQKIGVQIESISWMTADGFSTSVNAFMAQNLGARNKKRIVSGCKIAFGISIIWGSVCSLVLIAFPKEIFGFFISEQDIIRLGAGYLQILGISQVFMCVELTFAGVFAGLGKTAPPSVSSGALTLARIPMAYALMHTVLGLDGIWWSLTISGILKGIILFTWFVIYFRKNNPGA